MGEWRYHSWNHPAHGWYYWTGSFLSYVIAECEICLARRRLFYLESLCGLHWPVPSIGYIRYKEAIHIYNAQ
jgi:hypothetical protein